MMSQSAWTTVNQNLIAKAIGELTFEEVLAPTHQNSHYSLTLKSGVTYSFSGWTTTWEHLRIDATTLLRNGEKALSAGQFFIDAQSETGMDDIILGNFLEEMHNTLYSDLKILESTKDLSAKEVASWSGDKLQTILNGHPKILLNKGRIGWNATDLELYSPEAANKFQLHWVAVKNSILEGQIPSKELILESFSDDKELNSLIGSIDLNTYSVLPVHPWQWNRFIRIQFAAQIATQEIISLGTGGDFYLPQISIRTLSNVTRKDKVDIKLPLSILNTSCIRGLPAKSIALGPKVSEILKTICSEDFFLKSSNTDILLEKAGVATLQPTYAKIKEAPYRYHEYLGAVWRESSESKTSQEEKTIITASLFFQDEQNKSLIGEYISKSGLSKSEWLTAYFKVIVLPLYHLQLHYGVGMVAHGQNIILKMKNNVPTGMILKDFQGDLRLSTEMPEAGKKYFNEVAEGLTKLPPHYLIHDLITGHFITVLRFISGVMNESDELKENEFYGILANVIKDYTKDKKIDSRQDLLSKTIPRVLLNKVRFAIGYADSAERPLPLVGSELKNPICQ